MTTRPGKPHIRRCGEAWEVALVIGSGPLGETSITLVGWGGRFPRMSIENACRLLDQRQRAREIRAGYPVPTVLF